MKTSDFDYFLPEELIAQTPVYPRDSSRLLVYDRKKDCIEHKVFHDIKSYLKKGDVLVGAYLTGKEGELYQTYVIARVKILQNYKYFYKCDTVNDYSIKRAYALAEFNLDGEVVDKTHQIKDGGIEVTLTVRRILYGGN